MNAQIITIGDEILIGQIVNTNAAFIGAELTKIPIFVKRTITIGDDEETIMRELKLAWEASDVVIVTGGLGPTHDDITKSCVAKFFDAPLIMNSEVLADLQAFFEKRGMQLSQLNEQQALVPESSALIRNKKGTAPGIWMERDGKIMIVMPGVPHEMKEMMTAYVIPKLSEKRGASGPFQIILNLLTTGIAESTLFLKLGNIEELLSGAKLAFLPNQYGVRMRVTVTEFSEELAMNKISGIEQKIRSAVGRYIYGKEDETLEEVVGRLLSERGLKLAVAESCTGGLIAHRLTNISGSSEYFNRGLVSYSNQAKLDLLDVKAETIQQYGAVSLEVAKEMAMGARIKGGVDIGLGVTGILGPTGATENKPLGLVFMALSVEGGLSARQFRFGEDRLLNKDRASQAALDMLRRHLLGISYD